MNPDDPLGLIGSPQKKLEPADPLGLITGPNVPTKLAIAKRNAAMPHPEDSEDPEPSYATQALGGLASLARDIPGAEALQAGARSVLRQHPTGKPNRFGFVPTERDQSYGEALSDIRNAEENANPWVRRYNSIAGGTIAALAAPKGPWMNPLGKGGTAAVQGARFGALQGLLSADPASTQDRLLKAGKGGTIAAMVAGTVGDLLPRVTRVAAAKSLGTRALQRGQAMSTADDATYGKALAEGQGQVHPDVTAALGDEHLGIKAYADAARESPSLQGADDATILHETYKRLGERQRGLEAQIERAADYKAGPAREVQDIALAKQRLLDAADKIMPGYRTAVDQHRELASQYDAFQDAGDAANRIIRKSSVAGRNLQKNTPESFKLRLSAMDKAKAEAAREAMLGRLQEKTGEYLNKNPLKGFGIPKALGAIDRLAPYLDLASERINPRSFGFGDALAAALGSHFAN